MFSSQARNTLETYGRLAAAALDAGDALEEARHQANTAQALLDLSTSLAEIVSTEEMASKVVRAVPDVIDCDRVALILDDGSWQESGNGRFRLIAASIGYADDALASLSSRTFTRRRWGRSPSTASSSDPTPRLGSLAVGLGTDQSWPETPSATSSRA